MEDEAREINPSDLVPDTDTNKMKLLCLQISNQDYKQYKQLYEDTRLYEVYETMTLINAINWRPPTKEENGS